MTTSLDDILGKLHTDKKRLAFLKEIYSVGNTAVADRILTMTTDPSDLASVLESEIKHAKKQGMDDRFVTLAKRLIDSRIEQGCGILLIDKVIGWAHPMVADYAITQLTANSKNCNDMSDYDSLEHAGKIAQNFGKKDEAKNIFEKVLKHQMKNVDKSPSTVARTLFKLGRYNEAIDFYLREKNNYFNVGFALSIAKEHIPERVKKIAKTGYNSHNALQIGGTNTLIFLECAEILGKTEEARKSLLKYAGELNPYMPPRFYDSLVTSLVKLGETKTAESIFVKVAMNNLHEPKETVNLFIRLGGNAAAPAMANYLLARIDALIKEESDPKHILKEINEGYNATQNPVFLDKKLQVLEQAGRYEEASDLAFEIGKHDLAETYKTMCGMVARIKATQ